MHAGCLGRVSGGNTLSCLGVRTSERRRHREERGRSFERLRDRRSAFERRRHERRPGVREQLRLAGIWVASDGADLVASLKEATRDGAALLTRGSRNNDCEFLRHVLLPFSCGQARGSRRDWNNPEKAGRTSMKIAAHSTATKRASGSPLGAIKAWKVRMLTITVASNATANGT